MYVEWNKKNVIHMLQKSISLMKCVHPQCTVQRLKFVYSDILLGNRVIRESKMSTLVAKWYEQNPES